MVNRVQASHLRPPLVNPAAKAAERRESCSLRIIMKFFSPNELWYHNPDMAELAAARELPITPVRPGGVSGLPCVSAMNQVAYSRIQRPGQRLRQQRPRFVVRQPLNFQLGQPAQVRASLAGREHQRDRVRAQPPRDEPQRLRRRLIQPPA